MTQAKLKKVDPEIRVKRRNLKDLIRDEIYGANDLEQEKKGYLVIPIESVKEIAKRIAKRALIGPK
jgi:hypothetical protein